MKRIFVLIPILFFTAVFGQDETIINPKGNWYFGAEIGANSIEDYSVDKTDVSLQGGVLAEYYFLKQWSLSARIKYFKTGLAFYSPNTHSGSWFDLGHDEFYGTFRGAVVSIPVDLKWEFRVFKNLRANLKAGVAYNFETQSTYTYSANLETNYPTSYPTVNTGIGLNYFVDEKLAVYIDFEANSRASKKGSTQTLIFDDGYRPKNMLLNFGVKYNFKK